MISLSQKTRDTAQEEHLGPIDNFHLRAEVDFSTAPGSIFFKLIYKSKGRMGTMLAGETEALAGMLMQGLMVL